MVLVVQVAEVGTQVLAVQEHLVKVTLAAVGAKVDAHQAAAVLAQLGIAAQAHVANRVHEWLRGRDAAGRMLICPTAYCTRMADAGLGGAGYLRELGERLAPGIDVLWTGPEIVSREITVDHLTGVASLLQRPPVLWDNLFANDYDISRFFAGPFAGRPAAIRDHVRGVLVNPNNELPLNFGPLHTLGAFMRSGPDFDPRAAHLEAMRDWLPAFTLLPRGDEPRPAITADEVNLLGDCFYLPHEHGAGARRLLETAGRLLAAPGLPGQDADLRRTASGLIALTNRLADLQDRGLAHAMARRLWPLRDELMLLLVRLDAAAGRPRPDDDHLPGTFRGGFVADLRRLLPFDPGPSMLGVRDLRLRPAILRPARGDDLRPVPRSRRPGRRPELRLRLPPQCRLPDERSGSSGDRRGPTRRNVPPRLTLRRPLRANLSIRGRERRPRSPRRSGQRPLGQPLDRRGGASRGGSGRRAPRRPGRRAGP